jgi:hypothetical protein
MADSDGSNVCRVRLQAVANGLTILAGGTFDKLYMQLIKSVLYKIH